MVGRWPTLPGFREIIMNRLFSFCLLTILCACGRNKSIEINYYNETNNKKIIVIITEHKNSNIRFFDEKYILRDDSEVRYIDKFYYDSNYGLFRRFDVKDPAYNDGSILNIKSCLWIRNQCYLSNKKIERTFKTYTDREFYNEWNYEHSLNRIFEPEICEISLDKIEFDTTYSDTIRTLKFKIYNPYQLGHYTEYKSYDSRFNLVSYKLLLNENIISNFYRIDISDYKRLKKFRRNTIPIFAD